MHILQINSSARSQGSESTRLAERIVARLREQDGAATLQVRDLARDPQPMLAEAALGALFTPESERSPAQAVESDRIHECSLRSGGPSTSSPRVTAIDTIDAASMIRIRGFANPSG